MTDIPIPPEKIWSGFLRYLVAAERSPLSARRWLSRRELTEPAREELFAQAEAEGYLSPRRYAELYLRRAEEIGSKPFWILKKMLAQRGVGANHLAGLAFDELVALKNYVKKKYSRKLSRDHHKVILQKLRLKGFSSSLAKKALEELSGERS
ncbi:MAG: RecX family transcriptional regulator [Spirochaetia bacterium]|nr:RecX family transcriptional regulator [Spirochaetia bacterium]